MSYNCDQNTNFKMIKIIYVESKLNYSGDEDGYVNSCEYFEKILEIVPNDYNNKSTEYNTHFLGKITKREISRLKSVMKKQCVLDCDSDTKWNVLEIRELN
jgi:hypothetical protein